MTRLVRVAGESMAPTFRSSDLLLTRPAGRASASLSLSRGAIAVFRKDGLRMVKRVVGLPGDIVELEAGRLFVNGESVDGRGRVRGAHLETWLVPEANYFMAGDNAAASDDSRVWEQPFIPIKSIDAIVSRRLGSPLRLGWTTGRRRSAAAGLAAR